jgi:hypothetical protein
MWRGRVKRRREEKRRGKECRIQEKDWIEEMGMKSKREGRKRWMKTRLRCGLC